jgi:hypothetical protein
VQTLIYHKTYNKKEQPWGQPFLAAKQKIFFHRWQNSLLGEGALSCREKWLSPVIQATGRQEHWDGLRWKNLIALTDGFLGPHHGRLHDSVVNSVKSALQSHLTRQILAVLLFTEGQRFKSQASTPANTARPCFQYCNVTCNVM